MDDSSTLDNDMARLHREDVLPNAAAPERLAVVAESLEIAKRTVDTGRGTRVHKTVHDEVVQVSESLATDEVVVERQPIGRVVDEAPAIRYDGDTMVVPVIAERLVTRVELVLVEEVRITRTQRQVPFVQDVTLRREAVEVERFDESLSAEPLPLANP